MEELDWFIPYYIDIKLLTKDTHCILSFVHSGRRKSYFVHKYLSSVPIQELSFNVFYLNQILLKTLIFW